MPPFFGQVACNPCLEYLDDDFLTQFGVHIKLKVNPVESSVPRRCFFAMEELTLGDHRESYQLFKLCKLFGHVEVGARKVRKLKS